MAKIVVTPDRFTLVFFDAGRIAELAGQVADAVRFADDVEIRIEVDERSPLGRVKVASVDPITLAVEGGAFEDAKHPRQLSDRNVLDVMGRLLLRVKDRLEPGFRDAPSEERLSMPQSVAWTVYSEGRCQRLGLPTQKARWRYHFRNRHGFTDAADAAFDRLWAADRLTWGDIEKICAETAQAQEELRRS